MEEKYNIFIHNKYNLFYTMLLYKVAALFRNNNYSIIIYSEKEYITILYKCKNIADKIKTYLAFFIKL